MAGFIDDGDDFRFLTNVACNCNIQPGNEQGSHLGVVFNKLPVKEQLNRISSNDTTLDIPEFLRIRN